MFPQKGFSFHLGFRFQSHGAEQNCGNFSVDMQACKIQTQSISRSYGVWRILSAQLLGWLQHAPVSFKQKTKAPLHSLALCSPTRLQSHLSPRLTFKLCSNHMNQFLFLEKLILPPQVLNRHDMLPGTREPLAPSAHTLVVTTGGNGMLLNPMG